MREPAPFGKVMGASLVASIAAAVLAGAIVWLSFASQGAVAALPVLPAILLYALILGFPLAFGHALLLGLPAYLWLARRYQVRWWHAMGAGAVIGIVPATFWIGPASAREVIFIPSVIGASGAGGGLVFWAALRDLLRAP
jgi:hypothetical protein